MKARDASVVGACAAWILSAAPFFFDPSAFAGVSRTALAALPWIAYAGLPRSARADGLGGIAFEIALFGPALALGARFDAESGIEGAQVAVIAGGSVVCGALLSFAARESARHALSRALYTLAWFTLVAGIPILVATLVLGGASAFGPAPAWLAAIARASPLQWVIAHLPAESGASALPWAPLALLAVLCTLGLAVRKRSDVEIAA